MRLIAKSIGIFLPPLIACAVAAPAPAAPRITVQDISYGDSPKQVVTLYKQADGQRHKTIVFFHGGGWTTGGRGGESIRADVQRWLAAGWNVVNADYRLGVLDGTPGDGADILEDATSVVTRWRGANYVDPKQVVLVGDSAGGHLATTVAAKLGRTKVAGAVAWSPVAAPANAAVDGQAPGADPRMTALGQKAAEFFSYSYGTTSPFRYVKDDKAPPMWVAGAEDEWVTWDRQGGALCALELFQGVCQTVPGTDHADDVRDANPSLAAAAIAWAEGQRTP